MQESILSTSGDKLGKARGGTRASLPVYGVLSKIS